MSRQGKLQNETANVHSSLEKGHDGKGGSVGISEDTCGSNCVWEEDLTVEAGTFGGRKEDQVITGKLRARVRRTSGAEEKVMLKDSFSVEIRRGKKG